WWFRTPWFRNVFEGYLHNHRTLAKLGQAGAIGEAIRLALRYQEPGTGRLPNRLPELAADHERWERTGSLPAEYYVASDATTLLFRDSHYAWEQYQYPTYYLPEINAQWLRMLDVGQTLARRFNDQELAEELKQIAGLAKDAYKGIFWNPHANFLYNLVTLDRRI